MMLPEPVARPRPVPRSEPEWNSGQLVRLPAGTGAGGPVLAGTRFLAVADVYAPFEETEVGPQGDIGRVDQISKILIQVTSSHPLVHSGVAG